MIYLQYDIALRQVFENELSNGSMTLRACIIFTAGLE